MIQNTLHTSWNRDTVCQNATFCIELHADTTRNALVFYANNIINVHVYFNMFWYFNIIGHLLLTKTMNQYKIVVGWILPYAQTIFKLQIVLQR